MNYPTRITQPKRTYTFDYPWAVELAKTQRKVFWLPDEIDPSKDINDLLVTMNASEKHGTLTVLKLFTLYELFAGLDYWGDKVVNTFPRPGIQMMANCNSFFEINIHAVFYNKINQALNLDTDEFYNSYVDDPILKSRMEYIDNIINHEDNLISVAGFSMVEGVVLYSSFAFLKHFKVNGKNLITNIIAGINSSVVDENLHSIGGASIFNTYLNETEQYLNNKKLFTSYRNHIESELRKLSEALVEHETRIIDMVFEKGEMTGITKKQMVAFVKSRVNHCLKNIGFDPLYKITYNPIEKWFYTNINSYKLHDFFVGTGSMYNREWNSSNFKWTVDGKVGPK